MWWNSCACRKRPCRKMFGEYGLFCDGTFFGVICDDQLFIKITPQGEAAFPDLPKAPSHEGASDSFVIEDVDDPTMAVELTPHHL